MYMKEALRKKAKGKKGFTLVELVIVIAVLAIIAAIAIPTVSNVINNANASADASNAQSIELAIKTAQSECAANVTHHSDRADAVINGTNGKTLSTLLSEYGVSADAIDKPKTANKFFYNSTTGKVVSAKDATAAGNGYSAITSATAYTVADLSGTGTSSKDNSLSATIALTLTVSPTT
jgi:type IV pilus assembly protein PilA